MSTSTPFPAEKELESPMVRHPEDVKVDSNEENDPPSTRQSIFILAFLWTSWAIGITCDTFLEVHRRANASAPMSPLQRLVYTHDWDLWVYKHDYYSLLNPRSMNQIIITSLTLCIFLILAPSKRILPSEDAVTATCINLLVASCVLVAAWLGAEPKEVGVIAMPVGWQVGTSIAMFMRRVGISDLDGKFGVSDRTGRWMRMGSMGLFVGVDALLFGVKGEMISLILVMWGVNMVYKRLG